MDDKNMYEVITVNDESYDGLFFYGVKTTGIFCKPSCKSKTPLVENTIFFHTKEDAIHNGYRPCKRCRSDLTEYEPLKDIAKEAKEVVESSFISHLILSNKLRDIGVSKRRLNAIFKDVYGFTVFEYTQILRLKEVERLLINTDMRISDIAFHVGFESIATFNRVFLKTFMESPKEYRKKNQKIEEYSFLTEIGIIKITCRSNKVYKISKTDNELLTKETEFSSFSSQVKNEIIEYIKGFRKNFSFNYELKGTPFQIKIWNVLLKIPYGETKSYKEVAEILEIPNASRAVGTAIGKNPILIVVPCHRVIRSNGELGGYSGGLSMKEKLLDIEDSLGGVS